MASISDVENTIAALIGSVLYPNGSPPSALGYPIDISPGWPDPATLDACMVETAPGIPTKAFVSIYPLPTERNVTRYPVQRQEKSLNAPTYAMAASGQVVTVSGAAPSAYFAHNLAIEINGFPYLFQATTGLTAAQVAAGLVAAIQADFPAASASGAAIALPATAELGALTIGTTGAVIREVRRQERQLQIAVWTSNPTSRAAIADLFDPVMADTPFLTLPDGSSARLRYHGSREDDFTQKQRIYRRSLIWTVEYAITITEGATQIVAPTVTAENFASEAMFISPAEPIADVAVDSGGRLDFSDPADSDLIPGV